MYRKLGLLAIALCMLTTSCEHILGSKKKIDRLPLESAVRFHIGHPMYGQTGRSLFVWADKYYPTMNYYLRGHFQVSLEPPKIDLLIDEIEVRGDVSYLLFFAARKEWPLPYLPPAKYDFELQLHYPGGYTVTDRYTIQIIDSESLAVIPIAADSSEYSTRHLWD